MTFVPATCPSCGGSLQVPDDRDKVKCMYCGGDVVLRQEGHSDVAKTNTKNFLSLASTFFKAQNWQEAYKYYSLALENDAKHAEAWIGKGYAASAQDTLEVPRISAGVAVRIAVVRRLSSFVTES